jgi:hypothetical protein
VHLASTSPVLLEPHNYGGIPSSNAVFAPYAEGGTKLDVAYAAALLHDLGTVPACNGPQRFEVEGADNAAALLRERGFADEDVRDVWAAIALHTTPGVAERMCPLARLVRDAVVWDFAHFRRSEETRASEEHEGEDSDVEAELRKRIEGVFPRGELERVLAEAVAKQAAEKTDKARMTKAPLASWPGHLSVAWQDEPSWESLRKAF